MQKAGHRILGDLPLLVSGAPGQDRTVNTRFRRPMLYPLSYGRLSGRLLTLGPLVLPRNACLAAGEALDPRRSCSTLTLGHFDLAAYQEIAILGARPQTRRCTVALLDEGQPALKV